MYAERQEEKYNRSIQNSRKTGYRGYDELGQQINEIKNLKKYFVRDPDQDKTVKNIYSPKHSYVSPKNVYASPKNEQQRRLNGIVNKCSSYSRFPDYKQTSKSGIFLNETEKRLMNNDRIKGDTISVHQGKRNSLTKSTILNKAELVNNGN